MDANGNIPGSNLPDLGALKGREQNAKVEILRMFIRNSLLCPCGEFIRDEGVTLFEIKEEMTSTLKGLMPATNLRTVSFHSRNCPDLESLKGSDGYTPICIREIPKTEWLEEEIFERGDLNKSGGDRPEQ